MAKIQKAQEGTKIIKGTRPGLGVFRTEKKRTTVGGVTKPFKYKTESIDTIGYSKGRKNYQLKTEEGEGDKLRVSKPSNSSSKPVSRKQVPSVLKSLNKAKDGKWIQKAIKKPGALRTQLGAKPGQPIPAKLAKAAKAKGKLGQRARLAQTLKRMKK